MVILWDGRKSRSNLRKHGISFELAQQVFEDPHQVSQQDRHVEGEERWQTIGRVDGVVIVLVAHTVEEVFYENVHEEIIRIISARKATARERGIYEQGL